MASKLTVTRPAGFVAAGVTCGVKISGQSDLAVIAAERDASLAVVTTRNQIFGEPVRLIRRTWPKGRGKARAIVVNSGVSNVCTGLRGLKDAREMVERTAQGVGCDPGKVLVASTGVIGQPLPMDRIRTGIDQACESLSADGTGAAEAILTTDTVAKTAFAERTIAGRKITVAGIAKGAGMIAPSMATMLSFITTDAAVTPAALHKALSAAVDGSFNAVTIDSDTSTSDTVAVLASGAAGGKALTASASGYSTFFRALSEVCADLARQIAADGEGATKLVEVEVRGARSNEEAKIAARSVADSPLFKCAVHGGDPNWGRIAMALGKSAATVEGESLTIRIGGVAVFSKGRGRSFDIAKVEKHLAGREVKVACDLDLGPGRYTALTCDMSREYVAINADYHT